MVHVPYMGDVSLDVLEEEVHVVFVVIFRSRQDDLSIPHLYQKSSICHRTARLRSWTRETEQALRGEGSTCAWTSAALWHSLLGRLWNWRASAGKETRTSSYRNPNKVQKLWDVRGTRGTWWMSPMKCDRNSRASVRLSVKPRISMKDQQNFTRSTRKLENGKSIEGS